MKGGTVFKMEKLSSRKNAYIRHVRDLAAEAGYRRSQRQYLCDGQKTLGEAIRFGARIVSVLWKENAETVKGLCCPVQFEAPAELFDYASPMKNSPGPLFCVEIPDEEPLQAADSVLVLENVQDPGNVGTVIRSASAFGIDAVILTGDCADLYHPRTVRAAMGAVFRQHVLTMRREELFSMLQSLQLPLFSAALDPVAKDIRSVELSRVAVAVGSEGQGLSKQMLDASMGKLIIPMTPDSESLNAAVAASILMWEMTQRKAR